MCVCERERERERGEEEEEVSASMDIASQGVPNKNDNHLKCAHVL